MTTWMVIIGVGAGTYLLRVSMFITLSNRSLPVWTERPMALVGPAAIAALVASMTFTTQGAPAAPPLAELTAIAAGFVAVRRSGNVMHAFVAGLPALWMIGLVT